MSNKIIMTHSYNITGLTCSNCVVKARSALLKLGDVTDADVQLQSPQATITMQKHIPVATLQSTLTRAGNYVITAADGGMHQPEDSKEAKSWAETYKPLLLIFGYLLVLSVTGASDNNGFDWMTAMPIFMSGFFLSFSFFKLLHLNGFADSYSTYDIIAKRFRSWGFVYAFIELGLGLAYAANLAPVATNLVTLVVMSVSLAGVLQSVLAKRKIRCACLGAVFNLPMSTVTVVEDALMIGMSVAMLAGLLL